MKYKVEQIRLIDGRQRWIVVSEHKYFVGAFWKFLSLGGNNRIS